MTKVLMFMLISALAVVPAACLERQVVRAELISVTWTPKSNIDQVIGRDSELPKISTHNGGFYIATIATKLDLAGIQRENDYVARVDSRFCKDSEQLQLLTPLGIYSHGKPIGEISFGTNARDRPLQDTHNYEIVIFDSLGDDWKIPQSAMQKNSVSYPKFNLNNQPDDICIKVRMGGVRGGFNDLESNQILISKEELVRARGSKP